MATFDLAQAALKTPNYATQVLLGFKPATLGFQVVKATTSRCRQIVRQLPKSPKNKYRCLQNYCKNLTAPRAPPTMLKEVYVAISIVGGARHTHCVCRGEVFRVGARLLGGCMKWVREVLTECMVWYGMGVLKLPGHFAEHL